MASARCCAAPAHVGRRHRVDVGVERGEGVGQRLLVADLAALDVAVDPPPLDLEPRRLRHVEGLAVARGHQAVEALHAAPRAVGIVVGVRRPELVGAQDEPGAAQGRGPRQGEGVAREADGRAQELQPLAPVVGDPRGAFQPPHPARVERAHRVGHGPVLPHARRPAPDPVAQEVDGDVDREIGQRAADGRGGRRAGRPRGSGRPARRTPGSRWRRSRPARPGCGGGAARRSRARPARPGRPRPGGCGRRRPGPGSRCGPR